MTKPTLRFLSDRCLISRYRPKTWKMKRTPPRATCFAINRCQIAETPSEVCGFPFLVRIRYSPGICGAKRLERSLIARRSRILSQTLFMLAVTDSA